jgi:hypothetical protein
VTWDPAEENGGSEEQRFRPSGRARAGLFVIAILALVGSMVLMCIAAGEVLSGVFDYMLPN